MASEWNNLRAAYLPSLPCNETIVCQSGQHLNEVQLAIYTHFWYLTFNTF